MPLIASAQIDEVGERPSYALCIARKYPSGYNQFHEHDQPQRNLQHLADRLKRPQSQSEDRGSHKQASLGNFGDVKPISDGVYEMRIHFGPGYRLYYAREGRVVYLLLSGGDKSSQKQDIKTAIAMWKQIQEDQS